MELMRIESKEVTMTSLEMVEFINGQRKEGEPELLHKNFLVKVPQVLGEKGSAKFSATYIHPQNKQEYPCYRFPKREACLMAMSYSYELQAKVFDRMTALENRVPQTLPEALRLAADLAERNAEQAALIEQQKPAVEFVERYVDTRGNDSKCISDVAKLLGWSPRSFIRKLAEDGIIFKRDGCWIPYQRHVDEGRFRVTTGEKEGKRYFQARVNPLGVNWLAGIYG